MALTPIRSLKQRALIVLALIISSACVAQAGQVRGRLQLYGPPRSLAALRVTLRYAGTLANTSSQEAQRTQPDASGQFSFIDVRAGIYVVQVDGAGVLSAQWGALGPELAGQALVVHRDDDIHDLNIPLTSRPVLCGQIFGGDAKPLAKASVHAWKSDAAGDAMWMGGGSDGVSDGGNATADAEGRYRFQHFNPGYYILGAYAPDKPIYAFWKDANDPNTASPIDLVANGAPDTCPYDLQLKSTPPKPYDGPRYRVEGSLVAGATRLIGRRLEWELTPLHHALEGPVGAVPFDSAAPQFAFKSVPPGEYRLTLGAPPPSPGSIFSGPCHPFQRREVDQELTVSMDLFRVQAELRPVATIRGQIEQIRTRRDVPGSQGASAPLWVRLNGEGLCTPTNVSIDGSFAITDLDPDEYSIRTDMPLPGLYTSEVRLNGAIAPEGILQLKPGENAVKITQRFDQGTVDAVIEGSTIDGRPAGDEHISGLGEDEHILFLGAQGRIARTYGVAAQGVFEGYLPPARYIAVAGMNDELTWVSLGAWGDERYIKALAPLGTSFVIRAGKTTRVTLVDQTVEIQNIAAELGLPMYSR